MPRRRIVLLFAMLAFPVSAPAADPAPGAKELVPVMRVGNDDNAALRYWQAIVQLPQLSEEENELLSNANTASPTDDKAKALLARADIALRLVTRASTMPRCAWGLDMELDGPDVQVPYLAKMRVLSRYLTLRSRAAIAAGEHEAGVDDALTMLRMARHAGSDPMLISILVEYSIEAMCVGHMAAELPSLPKAQRERLAAALADHRRHPMAEGMEGERMFVPWIRRAIKEAPGKLNRLIPPGDLAEWARIRLVGAEPMLKGLEACYDDIAKLMTVPEADYGKAIAEFEKNVKESKNPLVRMVVPAVAASRRSEFRAENQMRVLRAAIAEADGGDADKAAAKEILGDLTVERKPFDGGIDYIVTNRKDRDALPITVRVGKEKKAP